MQSIFRAARPVHLCEAVAFLRNCRSSSANTIGRARHTLNARPTHPPLPSRTFTTSTSFRATVVAQNPRQDDDGNEMTITISDRAAKRLKQITSAAPQRNTLASSPPASSDSHLRVTVTSGGCHGFQYLMSLEPSEKIDPDEDTVFVAEGADSQSKGNAKVVMDESSLDLLKGSTVDFTTELIGSQFKIVGNPRASSSCGCGTSFDIE